MVTRTTNPLHFEDLEPHRFEDLVRQLVYDYRTWLYLEALGRSGADDGIDIRAVERKFETGFMEDVEDPDEESPIEQSPTSEELEWFIQCKRYQELGPTQVQKIVEEGPIHHDPTPYGYILAAACDFSKRSRDLFHSLLSQAGIEEHHIWGKAELEDMLFLPKNDHLLFAYFGISHRVRRKSMKSLVRSRLSTKRKFERSLGGIRGEGFHMVLIRDPSDDSYPFIKNPEEFLESPRWRYWELYSHNPPDHVSFVTTRYHAYVDWQSGSWDMWPHLDTSVRSYPQIFGIENDLIDPDDASRKLKAFMEMEVPKENRAWAVQLRPVHYDRILAVDEIGDVYNEGPHVLVDFLGRQDPFEPQEHWFLESRRRYASRHTDLDRETRVKYFPDEIPDKTEEWQEKLSKELEEGRSK